MALANAAIDDRDADVAILAGAPLTRLGRGSLSDGQARFIWPRSNLRR